MLPGLQLQLDNGFIAPGINRPWSRRTARKIRLVSAGGEHDPSRFIPAGTAPKTDQKLDTYLGLAPYDAPAPLRQVELAPRRVHLALKQHAGAPAQPVVEVGDRVEEGQLVAQMPEGQLGAALHASIGGRVLAVAPHIEIESA